MAPVTGTYTFTHDVRRRRASLRERPAGRSTTGPTICSTQNSVHRRAGRRSAVRHPDGLLRPRRRSRPPGCRGRTRARRIQVVPQWVLYPAPRSISLPPSNAGADQTITLPAVASLNGIARDDGLPSPANLTTTWSKISGREDSDGGTVVFGNPNAPVTTATFGADGIYVLRLTVSDGAVTVSDDVTITVNPVPISGREPGSWASTSTIRTTARISSRSSAADGSDRQLRLGLSRAGSRRDRRQLLGAMDRTGAGARERQLHVQHDGRRRRAPLGQRAAAHRQLGRSGGDDEDQRADRARGADRATTSGWSTTSTPGWQRRGCCGCIRDSRRLRFRNRSSIRPRTGRPA